MNPIALKKRIEIFCENKREYQIIESKEFGNVIMAEIGATMVGSIVHTIHGIRAVKGDESGYFQFGGSSIILLFKPGEIKIDADIIKDTQRHLETSVKVGEPVASINGYPEKIRQ